MKEAATSGKFETTARVENHAAVGLLARDFFDGVHCHGHGEKLANFGFVDVEGHGVALDDKGIAGAR